MHTVNYTYDLAYRYIPNHEGHYPAIDIRLSTQGGSADVLTVVDTGAVRSLVSGEYALALGLNLNEGVRTDLSALQGSLIAWAHTVRVKLFELEFDLDLCFSDMTLPRNLLGRDILERLQVGIREYHNLLHLLPVQ